MEEILLSRTRAKPVYICGQLVYCVGMVLMASTRTKWGVLLFSWAAGVMYSTLFTMPYLLVAHYHEVDPTVRGKALYSTIIQHTREQSQHASPFQYTQEEKQSSNKNGSSPGDAVQIRGIGTDVGIVSSMVFLAQFILSLTMGSIIAATGSTVAVVVAASVLSFCGAVTAVFVTYHDL